MGAFEEKTEKERLRAEIRESVRHCTVADQEENRALFPASTVYTLPERVDVQREFGEKYEWAL